MSSQQPAQAVPAEDLSPQTPYPELSIQELAERFHAAFPGWQANHVEATFPPDLRPDERDKIKPDYQNVEGPPAVQHWIDHLEGRRGLVISPLRPDSTVLWGCIDRDADPGSRYSAISPEDYARQIQEWGVKGVIFRSKSGGLHICLFAAEPIPATLMRVRLLELVRAFGLPDKTERRPNEDSADQVAKSPTVLNMPYFGGGKTVRPAVRPNGSWMMAEEALHAIEESRLPAAWFSTPLNLPKAPTSSKVLQMPRHHTPRDREFPPVKGNMYPHHKSELAHWAQSHPGCTAGEITAYSAFVFEHYLKPNGADRHVYEGWNVPKYAEWLVSKEIAKTGNLTEIIAAGGSERWLALLQRSQNREPKGNLFNISLALSESPKLQDIFKFDEFRQRVVIQRDCVEIDAHQGDMLEDRHITAVTRWLQECGIPAPVTTTGEAIHEHAQRTSNRYHPVRDYLNSLPVWDGVERVSTFFERYFGAHSNAGYLKAISICFLVSLIARIMRPGCKCDTVPVLEDKQGTKKSQGIAAIMPNRDWFADSLPDVGNKDAFIQLRGKWLIEIPEMRAFQGASAEKIKAFISAPIDTYRPPYGRVSVDQPRSVVFCASTNALSYLEDASGARRFWPVSTGSIDLEAIARDRDMLFAEAIHLYNRGVKWWLDEDAEALAAHETEQRQIQDAWTSAVANWAGNPQSNTHDRNGLAASIYSTPGKVLTAEVLQHGLGVPLNAIRKGDSQRVGNILQSLGYQRGKQERAGDQRYRFYVLQEAA